MHLTALVVSVFAGFFGGTKEREPLHAAARTGNVVQMHVALLHRPDGVNAAECFTKDRSPTPVHLAAYWNNVGVLKLLLARGGDVNDPGLSGETPLQHAASRGSAAAAEVLLKHGAALDPFSAVAFDKWDEVRRWFRIARAVGLHTRLANAAAPLGWGKQPLLNWAIDGGSLRMVELLLRNGAKVNPYADARLTLDWTPLHAAVFAKRPDLAELLVQSGAKIDAQDHDGYTALHRAVLYGDIVCARLLLKHGERVDTHADWYCPRACAPNGDPRTFFTPLHTAAEYERPELVALLLAHGADPNARATVPRPTGAYTNEDERKLATPQARAARGRTPLDVAATVPDEWDRDTRWYKPGKLTPARVLCAMLIHQAGGRPGAPRP